METAMPTTYDTGVSTGRSSSSTADGEFLGSLKGILRLVEMVISLIAFICAAVGGSKGVGGAADWCMFVTMFSFLVITITYFLWLFRVFTRYSGRAPIKFSEFVMYCTWDVLYFIAACVSAAFGGEPSMAAGAFFLFVMLSICAVDTFFHYRFWQSSDEGPFICGHQVSSSGASNTTSPSAAPPSMGENRTPTY